MILRINDFLIVGLGTTGNFCRILSIVPWTVLNFWEFLFGAIVVKLFWMLRILFCSLDELSHTATPQGGYYLSLDVW